MFWCYSYNVLIVVNMRYQKCKNDAKINCFQILLKSFFYNFLLSLGVTPKSVSPGEDRPLLATTLFLAYASFDLQQSSKRRKYPDIFVGLDSKFKNQIPRRAGFK